MKDRVIDLATNHQGSEIPKPKANAPFKIKKLGIRRGESALIYQIPSHSVKSQFYEKGITLSEFDIAYRQLITSGEFTRSWFNKNLSTCAKEGGCNFTTIGGVFELLDIAEYKCTATYVKK